MTGVTLSTDRATVDKADLRLSDRAAPPSQLWRALVDEQGDQVVKWLRFAAADVVQDVDDPDPEAFPGPDVASGAWTSLMAATTRLYDNRDQLLALLRELGAGHVNGEPTTLYDVRDGPLALLEAGTSTPTLAVELGREWWAQRADDRARQLQFLVEDLGAAVDLRLVTSRVLLPQICERHEALLPASAVNESPDRRAHDDAAAAATSTNSCRDAESVPLDPEDDAWVVLATIADTAAERRSMRAIRNDPLWGDVDRTTHDKRVRRLEDAGLVERVDVNGERHERLTLCGQAALDDYRDRYHSPLRDRAETASGSPEGASPTAGGFTRATELGGGSAGGDRSAAVSDPPKPTDGAVFTPTRGRGEDPGRPAAEAEAAAGGSREVPSRRAAASWMKLRRHHGIAAAASAGDVVLVDRDVEQLEHPGDQLISYDEDRGEIVVDVEWSDLAAHTGVRLAAALTDPRLLRKVVPLEVLGADLEHLLDGNLYLLRKGPCLGYLPDDEATGQDFLNRLVREGQQLRALSGELRDDDGDLRHDVASEVLRKAHGLAATVTWVLDLAADVQVVRQLRLPTHRRDWSETRIRNLRRFLATGCYLSSKYKAYNSYRVLVEDRDEKREDGLVEPNVNPEEPMGEHLGSWVLVGPGVDEDLPLLDILGDDRDLVDDVLEAERQFAVDVDVADGWTRSTAAAAAARVGRFRRLLPTPESVSVLEAMLGSPHDVAEAIGRLGTESRRRRLELRDVRYALSTLPADRILPDVGREGSIGAIVSALLGAEGPLSTSDLADRAGVSPQTVRNHTGLLEALGLVRREEQGEGRATLWMVRLPSDRDRHDEAARPRFLHPVSDPPKLGEGVVWQEADRPPPGDSPPTHPDPFVNVLEAVLVELGVGIYRHEPELWDQLRVGGPRSGSIVDVLEYDRWRWARPLVELLAALTGRELPDRLGPQRSTTQLGAMPPDRQTLLSRWVAESGQGPAAAD